MKLSKFVFITCLNGIMLMLFASVLASCMKAKINTFGHFSTFSKIHNKREIASSKASLYEEFEMEQDLQQIFLYCSVNELKAEKCFDKRIKQVILNFQNKKGLKKKHYRKFRKKYTYSFINKKVNRISKKIINLHKSDIFSSIKSKINSCVNNDEYKKCILEKYKNFAINILNKYNSKHPEITGYEYLYLKDQFIKNYKKKLKVSFDELKENEKEELLAYFKQNKKTLIDGLISDKSWLDGITSLTNAKSNCENTVASKIDKTWKMHTNEEIKAGWIDEKICIEVLSNNKISHEVNKITYNVFEKKIKQLFKALVVNAHIVVDKCQDHIKDKNNFTKCIEKEWDSYTTTFVSSWIKHHDNNFMNQQTTLLNKRLINQRPILINKVKKKSSI